MAKIDKILGSVSPLYGIVSGKGLFGGLRGLSPAMMAIDAVKDKKKRKPGEPIDGGASEETGMKRGGKVKKYAKGGSASSRGDGIAKKGKTKGKMR